MISFSTGGGRHHAGHRADHCRPPPVCTFYRPCASLRCKGPEQGWGTRGLGLDAVQPCLGTVYYDLAHQWYRHESSDNGPTMSLSQGMNWCDRGGWYSKGTTASVQQHGSSKGTPRVQQGCIESTAARVQHGYTKGTPRVHQGCTARAYQGYSKDTTRV